MSFECAWITEGVRDTYLLLNAHLPGQGPFGIATQRVSRLGEIHVLQSVLGLSVGWTLSDVIWGSDVSIAN